MILKFNPNLFSSEDRIILSKVSKIIMEIKEEKFIWDQENFDDLFLSDNEKDFFKLPFSESWLSKIDKEDLLEKIEEICQKSAYVTSTHKKYLTTINVGIENGETHPTLVYDILMKPSKIIVENATNDWKFIKGISHKYDKSKSRKEIYKLVRKSIDNQWLLPEQAGGKGQIISRIKDLENNAYMGILKYKVATIFDSDRNDNNSISHEQKLIIEFIKNKQIDSYDVIHEDTDIIVWHMLYKKELENYVPKDLLMQHENISTSLEKIQRLSQDEYDFIKFEDMLKKEVDVKNVFPELFLTQWTKDKLEQRCAHHKVNIELPNGILEQVSEMEQILLKIAKII